MLVEGTTSFAELPQHDASPSALPTSTSASLALTLPRSTAPAYDQALQPHDEKTPKTNAALNIASSSASLQISPITTPNTPPAGLQAIMQHPLPTFFPQPSPRPISFPPSTASSTSYMSTSLFCCAACKVRTQAPPAASPMTGSRPHLDPAPSLVSCTPPPSATALPSRQRIPQSTTIPPAASALGDSHTLDNQNEGYWTVQGFPQDQSAPPEEDDGDEVSSAPPAHRRGACPCRTLSSAYSFANNLYTFNALQKAQPLGLSDPTNSIAIAAVAAPASAAEASSLSAAQWAYKAQLRRPREEDIQHTAMCGVEGLVPAAKYPRQLPPWRQETSFDWGLPLITDDDDDGCSFQGWGEAPQHMPAGDEVCGGAGGGQAPLESRIMEQMEHLNKIAWTGGRCQQPSMDSAAASRMALVSMVWQQTEQAARQLQRYPLSLQHRSFHT